MKFINFIAFTLILGGYAATAQELRNKFGEAYYTADLYKKDNPLVEGTPYLDEQFKPAKINQLEETKLVRLDALNHQAEILVRDNSVMVLDDSRPFTIRFLDGSGKVYVNREYTDENGVKGKSVFLRYHETGEFALYEREEIRFYKEVKAQGYQDYQPPQYRKERSTFYLLNKNEKDSLLVALPSRAKKFAESFPEGSKDLKNFIKEERLDPGEAQDLVRVLTYYFKS